VKQVSQSQADYHLYKEALANRPGDNWFKQCGIPLSCAGYDNLVIYSSVKTIMHSSVVSQPDLKRFNKFLRLWQKHYGKLPETYLKTIQSKTIHYGHKIKNKQLREQRLSQKKSV
jgi:hypothetical protein